MFDEVGRITGIKCKERVHGGWPKVLLKSPEKGKNDVQTQQVQIIIIIVLKRK